MTSISETFCGVDYWKSQRNSLSDPGDDDYNSNEQIDRFKSLLSTNLSHLDKLMKSYILFLSKTENQIGDSSLHTKQSLTLECRYALRYVLSLFSLESQRRVIQETIVYELKLHKLFSVLLSMSSVDFKCQSLAAKIFCNLGTSNKKCSLIILDDISISHSEDNSNTKKWKQINKDFEHKELTTPSKNLDDLQLSSHNNSWCDMVHVTGSMDNGRREAFAAVVASLHNCILAVLSKQNDRNLGTNSFDDGESSLTLNLQTYAKDQILMCNLVRYILPKETIRSYTSTDIYKNSLRDFEKRDMSDDGTFWVSLLFELLFSRGLFPQIFETLGFSNHDNAAPDSDVLHSITPEQIVVLNCFDNLIHSYNDDYNRNKSQYDGGRKNPLGGYAGEEGIKKTVLYVGQQLMNLRKRFNFLQSVGGNLIKEERYQGEKSCVANAVKIMVDILGTTFCMCDEDDGNFYASTRIHLGQKSLFLADSLLELGAIVDKLDVENRGLNPRELVISEDDQHCIVGLVRVIGNLCFKCQPNQDLIRTTCVPIQNAYDLDTKDCNNTSTTIEKHNLRNGLHVILSCTSFAYGCFTLREFCIVAIRYILDENEANQLEVARLEAQQVINTPEMEKLGVKLDLSKGQVKVSHYSGKS